MKEESDSAMFYSFSGDMRSIMLSRIILRRVTCVTCVIDLSSWEEYTAWVYVFDDDCKVQNLYRLHDVVGLICLQCKEQAAGYFVIALFRPYQQNIDRGGLCWTA